MLENGLRELFRALDVRQMRRALEEMVVEGVKTSLPLHRELLQQPDVLSGDYSIKWLEDYLRERPA